LQPGKCFSFRVTTTNPLLRASEPAWRDILLLRRLKRKALGRQCIQMIRQILPRARQLPGTTNRLRRGFYPPAIALLLNKVALAVLNPANRQPILLRNANGCHVGNFPYWRWQSRPHFEQAVHQAHPDTVLGTSPVSTGARVCDSQRGATRTGAGTNFHVTLPATRCGS